MQATGGTGGGSTSPRLGGQKMFPDRTDISVKICKKKKKMTLKKKKICRRLGIGGDRVGEVRRGSRGTHLFVVPQGRENKLCS